MVFIEKNGKGYKRGGEDEETVTSGYTHGSVLYYQRFKAGSEAQRGKPKGTLESEICIAMLLLGQRPPRHAWLGRKRCHRGCVRAKTLTRHVPAYWAIRENRSVSPVSI